MPVQAVRIEEQLWSSAPMLRKEDWRALIHDILSGTLPWPSRETCTLIAGCDDNNVNFTFTTMSTPDDKLTIPRANIAAIIKEYTDLIKKLATRDMMEVHFEALDMAKRVVHDAGARKLAVLLPGVGSNFETNRRLFSLVVSLTVDTTRLGPYPGHRHHGKHK